MNHKWLLVLRDSATWLLLILLSDIFLIFLVWLAAPDAFPTLLGLMVAFTVGSMALGLWLTLRKRQNQEEVFHRFLAEPTLLNEENLIDACDPSDGDLLQALGRYLRELQYQIAQHAHQAKDFEEFIETWVHEMKTPLSLATLVLINRRGDMSEQVYRRFEHVRRELGEEVDRILYYARSQADHMDYRFERVSLVVCCSDVLQDLESLFTERNVEIIQNVGDLAVVSDMKTLQFILTQIILNSVKYVRPGTDPIISIEGGENAGQTRRFLRIADNGIGVSEADLPFIFDKGFTGNHPEHRKATGLGLYLVKKYCDDLKIEVEVESQIDQGMTIHLFFPMVEKNSEEQASD
ncbi:MAG: sensor histidine kinase [Anaerolineaceae bacterium]|nr:sensor histidine kinase [Anaerolineaceae bacterium]